VPRPFLTARWQDLAIITYEAPRELLEPRVPRGLELDEWDGRVFVSLVAFDFRDCRVLGVRWPGLVNFPEVNLRFYVREPSGRRGVVFVREFVPSRVIAWVARAIYGEPYSRVAMSSRVESGDGRVAVNHALKLGGSPGRVKVEAQAAAFTPTPTSIEHHFKEHSWGYGTRAGRTTIYEVRHEVWQVRRNPRAEVGLDFGAAYGPEWGILSGAEPAHVMLAVGSSVEVWPRGEPPRSA
jgi:uncharacterized protein YqjF (DUF2071 family)